jgi:hypothetical protein
MMKAISVAARIIGPVVFLSLLLAVPAMGGPVASRLLKQDGNGKLYNHDGLRVAVLSGTFHEMGRQYGTLLGDEIRGAYQSGIVKSFVDNPSHLFTIDELNALGDALFKTLPMRQKELLRGISEGARISLQEAILAAEIPAVQIVVRKKFGGTSTSCTSGAAWGRYTADGKVITVRNFDYPTMFRNLLIEYRVLVVLKPSDGSHSVAGLGFAGNVSFGDTMNDQGLYVETNNAGDSGGLVMYPNRTDVHVCLVPWPAEWPSRSGRIVCRCGARVAPQSS